MQVQPRVRMCKPRPQPHTASATRLAGQAQEAAGQAGRLRHALVFDWPATYVRLLTHSLAKTRTDSSAYSRTRLRTYVLFTCPYTCGTDVRTKMLCHNYGHTVHGTECFHSMVIIALDSVISTYQVHVYQWYHWYSTSTMVRTMVGTYH